MKSRTTLSLRLPIWNEEERAHFQRRLGFVALTMAILGAGFLVVMIAIMWAVQPERAAMAMSDRSSLVEVGTALGAATIWLVLRKWPLSIPQLSAIDYVFGIGLCICWAAMAAYGSIPLVERPEMIAILASNITLSVRGALVPSPPLRSGLIGLLGFAPIVLVTPGIYGGQRLVGPDGPDPWLAPAVNAVLWTVLCVASTTVVSHIVFGLRQQVRKAMQLGQYVLEEKVGEGGMGVVYKASHAMLRRPTAIKLLSGSTGSIARFEREVQITARLTHPNTVAVFDYGRTPDGVFYYAMEYLEGVSLESLVTEHGPQPPSRVVHVLLQMCGALAEAHGAGLVHRDIKPANVMLTVRGDIPDVVKVLDFGLVKETAAEQGLGETAVENIVGTPHYLSPEAILDPGRIDARADLYAVGATAYFMLTGRRVFEGKNLVDVCSQHLHQAPIAPSQFAEIPEALEALVLACLAKKPEERPSSATELATRLRACKLPEWTTEESAAWWRSWKPAPRQTPSVNTLGDTVAVTLEGRLPSVVVAEGLRE